MTSMSDRGEVVFYQHDSGKPAIEVRMEGGTVWLTQAQVAELFQTTPQNITQHLKAIFAEGVLTESATCKDDLQVRQERAHKPNMPSFAPKWLSSRSRLRRHFSKRSRLCRKKSVERKMADPLTVATKG